MGQKQTTIALIGNPNCGKTTLFNALSGSSQQVGNWPGVTVERKSGFFTAQDHQFELVDLPGIYTLVTPPQYCTKDEQLASEYIQAKEYHGIINVIDAVNLERNLFLSAQLIQLGIPMVIALNRLDLIERQGIKINLEALSLKLGCPVVPLIARKQVGLEGLKNSVLSLSAPRDTELFTLPESVMTAITELQQTLTPAASRAQCLHWLEGGIYPQQVAAQVETQKLKIEQQTKQKADSLIAYARYQWIEQVVAAVKQVKQCARPKSKQQQQSSLDKILCHRILGFPIFLAAMYALFFFAINVGGAFQDFFELTSEALFVDGLGQLLTTLHSPDWLTAFVVSGIGQGISTVITFIPVIGAMYLALAFLEDSGYLARAAFVMDRLMQTLGLPGKAFVPMIIGFGCNVPAIMGSRTLENKRDRILTVMMSPFMSCGARLAIFTVFASAFYPEGGQNMIFLLYVIGIAMAVLTGLMLKSTFLKGENSPFVLEMPPFQWPHWQSLWFHAWHRLRRFIVNAGKLIVPVCILIGVLNHLSVKGEWLAHPTEQSVLSTIGQKMTPVFKPFGMEEDNWPAAVGLLTGILAKEVVIGTLNSLYTQPQAVDVKAPNQNLPEKLWAAWGTIGDNVRALAVEWHNPVAASASDETLTTSAYGEMVKRFNGTSSAFAYLLFVLLYFPCVSATAAMVREVHRGWTLFSVCWTTGIAYTAAVLFYQTATFLEHPLQSTLWIGLLSGLFVLTMLGLHYFSQVFTPRVLPTRIVLNH